MLSLGETQFFLVPGLWRIGRDAACEIRLADDAVSRRHASLRVENDRVLLTEHGSRNGVRVNGKRVHGSIEVEVGDSIEISTTTMRLDEQGEPDTIDAATKPMPRLPKIGEDSLTLLSSREREVFEKLAHGQTQREIAEALGLSVKTVETYRARIGEKLGLRTRADLVRFALESGVLRPR